MDKDSQTSGPQSTPVVLNQQGFRDTNCGMPCGHSQFVTSHVYPESGLNALSCYQPVSQAHAAAAPAVTETRRLSPVTPFLLAAQQPSVVAATVPGTNIQPDPAELVSSDGREHTAADGIRYHYSKKNKRCSWETPIEDMLPCEKDYTLSETGEHMCGIHGVLEVLNDMVASRKGVHTLEQHYSAQILHGLLLMLPTNEKLLGHEAFESKVILENVHELELVLKDLKIMEALWREKNSLPPTKEEQTLLGMILGHVYTDLFLSQREEFSRLLQVFGGQKLTKEMRSMVLDFGKSLSSADLHSSECARVEDDENEPHGSCVSLWLDDSFDALFTLHSIVEDCVGRVNGTEQVHGMEQVEEGSSASQGVKEYLMDILYALDRTRHRRFYAPPILEELKLYREIRDKVLIIQDYIITKKRSCSVGWSSCFSRIAYEDGFNVITPPPGHALALVSEEFPRVVSHVRSCKERLGHIMENLVGKEGMITDTKRAFVAPNWDVRKKPKCDNFTPAAWGVAAVEKFGASLKTREHHLTEILQIFRMMESSCWRGCPSFREVRLFAQIVEHVKLSIWLFDIDRAPDHGTLHPVRPWHPHVWSDAFIGRSTDLPGEEQQMTSCTEVFDTPSGFPDVEVVTEATKSREDYLQDIVSAVEKIKAESSYTISPSRRELELYLEIQKYLNVLFMQARCYSEPQKEKEGILHVEIGVAAEEIKLLKYLLKAIYDRQLNTFRGLHDDFSEMLSMIFPDVPEYDPFSWVQMYKDQVVDKLKEMILSSPEGHDILTSILLTIDEAHVILDEFTMRLYYLYMKMDEFMEKKKECHLQALLIEACSALYAFHQLQLEAYKPR